MRRIAAAVSLSASLGREVEKPGGLCLDIEPAKYIFSIRYQGLEFLRHGWRVGYRRCAHVVATGGDNRPHMAGYGDNHSRAQVRGVRTEKATPTG
jgi:hypothetical protein